MTDSPALWHTRFQQQAGWTQALRQRLVQQASLPAQPLVLEVGCGTGAIMDGWQSEMSLTGIDLDANRLTFASSRHARLAAADAHNLPFLTASFELTFCHFLLLWVASPMAVLAEMARVTRPGGWLMAFAEPDHDARIDYPEPLGELGRLQTAALHRQGADPALGRRLRALFASAGLQNITSGVLGGEWGGPPSPEDQALEWQVLANDLSGLISPTQLKSYAHLERQSVLAGERLLFVPTFFAIGQIPG